jgi:glycosyltransferase involved in cell wall biosynthesis
VSAGHEVTVLASTAEDVSTWAPVFASGAARDGDVTVERFDAHPADPDHASRLLRHLAAGRGDAATESAWVKAHGPVSTDLLRRVATSDVDAIVLWTYLFATTQLAMPLVSTKSILVPTAHDEPMLRLAVTRGVIALSGGFAFLTPEEQALVADFHDIAGRPAEVVGAGISPGAIGDPARLRARQVDLPPRFALYLGRKDAGKGIAELVAAHDAYRRRGGALALVVAGPGEAVDGAIDLGYVDDETRADLIAACDVLVQPSIRESLSLVLLEAWHAGRPTLANANSEAAAGQTERSGGGLLYVDPTDYGRQLRRLEGDAVLRDSLAGRGSAWVGTQTWDAVVERWNRLLERLVSEASG